MHAYLIVTMVICTVLAAASSQILWGEDFASRSDRKVATYGLIIFSGLLVWALCLLVD
jgi:hypothetical protein